jgi:23S rRNA (uracil1939-C5)-methyltransferase
MTEDHTYEELAVVDLAFDGKAVAYRDGKVIFLDGGLPGERVLAEVVRSRKRYDFAAVKEVLQKSPMRIAAPCSHVGECGGCAWQDLSYQQQLIYKRKQVVDCLERIGGLESVKVADAIGSLELFHYRNKMEFSFHAGPDGEFTLGLHRRGKFDEIFDLDACWLASDTCNRIVAWVRQFVRDEQISVYDVLTHVGYVRFLAIRESKRTGQIMVNLVTNYGDIPQREKLASGLKAAFPQISTLVHNQNGQRSNIAVGEIEQVVFGTGYIEERLFESTFRIRANSFFQTNTLQTETLYHTALDMLGPERSDRMLDLYCGTGSIGILTSRYVRDVLGVELVADAVKSARENADINHVSNARFVEGDVKDVLAMHEREGARFDIVVVDPPRAGLHPTALKRTIQLAPHKLAYVSCNPATFARDAAEIVKAGYRLPEVRPVDMFPHTKHIELIGLFHRP